MILSTQYKVDCHTDVVPKKRIVLHFTVGGSASGAIAGWNAQNNARVTAKAKDPNVSAWKIGTPFVVDRDPLATVFQVFDPRMWAYGLGINNPTVEASSIQIEIVNWGPLRMDAQGRYFPKDYPDRGMYVPAGQVIRKPFRGENFFHAFTDAQYQALGELVKKLCIDFQIPRAIPPADKRGQFAPDWAIAWRGICAHENFYGQGKWDIGPAFDWVRLLESIQ